MKGWIGWRRSMRVRLMWVKLCFFVGLTQEEAAKELGVSLATAERLWAFARAWLFKEMHKSRDTTP